VFTTESGTATKIEKTQNTLKSGTAKHMIGRTTVKSSTALAILARVGLGRRDTGRFPVGR